MFPSKHLPKNYIFKHSTFYTKDNIKRENNLPLLPNSLNLLLVSLWGKLMSPWASSTSASTSCWPWSSTSISSWSWSPSANHSSQDTTLRVEEYSMSLWCAETSSFRQWHTVCEPTAGQAVHGGRNKTGVRIGWAPRTNGQVESANRVLLRSLKSRLEKDKGTWAEEVPRIVWAYHTMPQSTTRETPFNLVYRSDAMILVEIMPHGRRRQLGQRIDQGWEPSSPARPFRWSLSWPLSGNL